MKSYSWNADDYRENSGAQQKWAQELLGKLKLEGSKDILDLGCGDGIVTAEIAGRLPRCGILGIDNSPAMIQLAEKNFPRKRHPNLTFSLLDASHLPFHEEFDLVFSNAALHWIKDHRAVVHGMYDSLKKSGRILLQMGGKGNAAGIVSAVAELQTREEWLPYFADFEFPYGFYGIDVYEELLTAAGFTVHRVELIPKDMIQQGKAGLEGWIRTTWLPYTERVPQDRRDDFVEAVSEHYLRRNPPDSDGNVHVAMVRLEVEAEKGA